MTIRRGVCVLVLGLLVACLSLSHAAELPLDVLRGQDPEGFRPIFNGRDFEGWAGPIDDYEHPGGSDHL